MKTVHQVTMTPSLSCRTFASPMTSEVVRPYLIY